MEANIQSGISKNGTLELWRDRLLEDGDSNSAATLLIRNLAESAQVDAEKCNPRALRYFHQSFTSEAEAKFAPLVEETLRRQLEEEQMEVGWEI